MKIRGKIGFDPEQGSILLRDDMSGYDSKYPSAIVKKQNGGTF